MQIAKSEFFYLSDSAARDRAWRRAPGAGTRSAAARSMSSPWTLFERRHSGAPITREALAVFLGT
jgi:hypothetical protein